MEKFWQAAELVRSLFKDARRADGAPYEVSLWERLSVVAAYGGDEAAQLAVMLKDVLSAGEGCTYDQLVEAFGAEVAKLVSDLTEDFHMPWKCRKLGLIETAAEADRVTCLLLAADRLCDLRASYRDIQVCGWDAHWHKHAQPWVEQCWFNQALISALYHNTRQDEGPPEINADSALRELIHVWDRVRDGAVWTPNGVELWETTDSWLFLST